MKQFIAVMTLFSVLMFPTLSAAQTGKLASRMTKIEVETETAKFEVFSMELENGNHYYLSLGNVGLGNHTVQVNIDPVSEMFVLLGSTLDEAIATLDTLRNWVDGQKETFNEIPGCIAIIQPRPDLGTLNVMTGKALWSRYLEFSVDWEGLVVAANIQKGDLNNLRRSLKLYRKIHPKEL